MAPACSSQCASACLVQMPLQAGTPLTSELVARQPRVASVGHPCCVHAAQAAGVGSA